jgi:hypothetical protein
MGLGALTDITNQGLTMRGQNLQNQQFNANNQLGFFQALQQAGQAGNQQAMDLSNILFSGGQNILGMGPSVFGSRTNTITGLPAQNNPLWTDLYRGGLSSIGLGGQGGFPKIFGGGPPGGGGWATPTGIAGGASANSFAPRQFNKGSEGQKFDFSRLFGG